MAGKKQTKKALQLEWQSTPRSTDVIQEPGRCRVAVVGVGGVGSNAITQLTKMGIKDTYTIVVDTDSLNLDNSQADLKVLIGEKLTQGLGANGDPALGRASIEESQKQMEKILAEMDIVFIAAGLGGRTGTGVAPLVAKIARRKGAVTVGVATKPFQTEKGQIKSVSCALTELRRECDTIVVIDNSKLTELTPQLPIDEAVKVANQVLAKVIKAVMQTISVPNLINLDISDFKTIMKSGGFAKVGIGESDAPNRAEEAVQNALKNPLSGSGSYVGARGALIHVTGDSQMTIKEATRVREIVTEMMENDTQVIWGAKIDPELNGRIRVTVVMTGIDSPSMSSNFASVAPQLFNLEPYSQPEKKLPVDLGLYQLESF